MSTAVGDRPVVLTAAAARGERSLPLRVRLRDGREVVVRQIDMAHADLLREFDGSLSDRSRRLRYLGWMAPMPVERATAMTTTDGGKRIALVAISDGGFGQVMVGHCRLYPIEESANGVGMAIAVADSFQDAELGRVLLELILATAAERGLTEVVADVRYDNARMMHLLETLGFEITKWELGVVTFCRSSRAESRRCGGSVRRECEEETVKKMEVGALMTSPVETAHRETSFTG